MKCVNLQRRFGGRHRVAYEESYYAQYGPGARTDDPWLRIIPCRHGHIYPHGGDTLAASTDRRGAVATRLVALPGVTLHQDGSDGVTVLFHVDRFGEVAEIMQPRRRRRLSEAQRRACTERLARVRPQALRSDAGAALESRPVENTAREP